MRTILRLLVIFLHHVIAPALCPPVCAVRIVRIYMTREKQHKWVNNMAVSCVSCLNIFVHYYYFVHFHVIHIITTCAKPFFYSRIYHQCMLILYLNETLNEKGNQNRQKRLVFILLQILKQRSLFVLPIPIFKTKI